MKTLRRFLGWWVVYYVCTILGALLACAFGAEWDWAWLPFAAVLDAVLAFAVSRSGDAPEDRAKRLKKAKDNVS